jgi:hypothetical protein
MHHYFQGTRNAQNAHFQHEYRGDVDLQGNRLPTPPECLRKEETMYGLCV